MRHLLCDLPGKDETVNGCTHSNQDHWSKRDDEQSRKEFCYGKCDTAPQPKVRCEEY